MEISGKQKNDHYRWLRAKLIARSKVSAVTQQLKGSELVFSLTVQPEYGKRKIYLPVFHPNGTEIRDRIFTWQFLESWEQISKDRFRYCRLSLMLSDLEGIEMLSIHWNVPCPDGEPYQPHWHFQLERDRYHLRKVHIPLDSGWGKVSPRSLDDYHRWVEGLLLFIEDEFAKSLKLKRAS